MENSLIALSSEKDLNRLLSRGFVFRTKKISVRYLPNEFRQTRLAFSIPKTTIKRAVKRNKIKRWIKEVLRKRLKDNKIPLDIFIKIHKDINSFEEIQNFFKAWMDQIK